MKKSRLCIGEVSTFKLAIMKIALVGIFLAFQSVASAAPITYTGTFVLDNTSSIDGAPLNAFFHFSLTLDGSAEDIDHTSDMRADGGLTMYGQYTGAVIGFEMTRDDQSPGTWDPSTLNYNFAGSTLLTTDVNTAADSDSEVDPPMNEHLTIDIPVLTPGSPVDRVYFNLYNSALYNDPKATQQLWLDTSTPANGFTLDDLFLHGMDTLSEFKSMRNPESLALVDSVFLDGADTTFGSGTLHSLTVVPIPPAFWLMGSGLLGLIGMAKRKKVA